MPTVRLPFQDDERATPAVLNFLRGTKVGKMVTLAPPEEEGEWEGLGEIELWPKEAEGRDHVATRVGRGHPRMYFSFFLSFVSFSFVKFVRRR